MTVLSGLVAKRSTLGFVAKFFVSLPDDLLPSLKKVAGGDVGAFIAEAVRNELARRHLRQVVRELEEQVGPVDQERVAKFNAMFAEIKAANREAEDS